MHIVFYSPQTLPSIGGLQYVVHYWAEALYQRGYKVTIISETPESTIDHAKPTRGDSPIHGVPPYNQTSYSHTYTSYSLSGSSEDDLLPSSGKGPEWGPTILRNIPFLQKVSIMRSADKIIMFNVSLKGMPAWLLSGKALYLSHHTALWYQNGPKPWQQKLKQWVANYIAKKNCACSGYIASLYQSCEVIYSPYRSDVFIPGTMPRIPGSILFAGRLVSDKGADLLLEACAIIKAKGIAFSLTMVGHGPDRQKLLALAAQLKIYRINSSTEISYGPVSPPVEGSGGAVVPEGAFSPLAQDFPLSTKVSPAPVPPPTGGPGGAVSQPLLVHLMQTHEVMVVPSRMEPMGMVVAEGLACGCNMVVSNQGGMPEVGGSFCHYFESGNAAGLAVALEKALTNPLCVDADALKLHLQQFTIGYSVNQLEKWLA